MSATDMNARVTHDSDYLPQDAAKAVVSMLPPTGVFRPRELRGLCTFPFLKPGIEVRSASPTPGWTLSASRSFAGRRVRFFCFIPPLAVWRAAHLTMEAQFRPLRGHLIGWRHRTK